MKKKTYIILVAGLILVLGIPFTRNPKPMENWEESYKAALESLNSEKLVAVSYFKETKEFQLKEKDDILVVSHKLQIKKGEIKTFKMHPEDFQEVR